MKVPISVGLAHPERIASGASRLDFLALQDLGFEALDDARFPGLALAYAALAGPEGSTTVLNAANEVAVAAFLDRRARFTDIHGINAGTLERVRPGHDDVQSLESLLALDARSRRAAAALVQELYR
jgi:1-deoxy-D-xylulose-5-phosphate reductoisomerase